MASVTEDTTVAKILEIKGAEEILRNYKFPCLGCPMAQMEIHMLKVGEVCDLYGIDSKKLISELNKLK